jgi:hypothetical protein
VLQISTFWLDEAEGEGFEPSSDETARNGFQDRPARCSGNLATPELDLHDEAVTLLSLPKTCQSGNSLHLSCLISKHNYTFAGTS